METGEPGEPAVGRPWPYRKANEPLPTFCPKCGRTLLPYAWGDREPYLELACAGRTQWFFRRWLRGGLFFVHHYEFTVGQGSWSQFDNATGQRNRMSIHFGKDD